MYNLPFYSHATLTPYAHFMCVVLRIVLSKMSDEGPELITCNNSSLEANLFLLQTLRLQRTQPVNTCFSLFPKLKTTLKGRCFVSREEIVKKKNGTELYDIPISTFQRCYQLWQHAGTSLSSSNRSTLEVIK